MSSFSFNNPSPDKGNQSANPSVQDNSAAPPPDAPAYVHTLHAVFARTKLVIPKIDPDLSYSDYAIAYEAGVKAFESAMASMQGIGDTTVDFVCLALQQYRMAPPAKMFAVQQAHGMTTMAVDQRDLYINWAFIDINTAPIVIFGFAHEGGHIALEHIPISYASLYEVWVQRGTTKMYQKSGANFVNSLLMQAYNSVLDIYTNDAVSNLPATHSANDTAIAHREYSKLCFEFTAERYGIDLEPVAFKQLVSTVGTADITTILQDYGMLMVDGVNNKLDELEQQEGQPDDSDDDQSDDSDDSDDGSGGSGEQSGDDDGKNSTGGGSGGDTDDSPDDSDDTNDSTGSDATDDESQADSEDQGDGADDQGGEDSDQSSDGESGGSGETDTETGAGDDTAQGSDSDTDGEQGQGESTSTNGGTSRPQTAAEQLKDQLAEAIKEHGQDTHILPPEGGFDDDGNEISANILDNQYVEDTTEFYEQVMEITSQALGPDSGMFKYYKRRPKKKSDLQWERILKQRYQFPSRKLNFPKTNPHYLQRGILAPWRNDGKTNVLVVCDVSGSMGGDWNMVLGTLHSLCVGKQIKSVFVLPVDDQVHVDMIREYEAGAGFNDAFDMLMGGGTDFGITMQWLHESKFVEDNKISSVLYVSDLYGECRTEPDPRWGLTWIATATHCKQTAADFAARPGHSVIVTDIVDR